MNAEIVKITKSEKLDNTILLGLVALLLIIVLPSLFVALFFVFSGLSLDSVYQLGFDKDLKNNWLSLLGVIATVVVALNVLLSDISKSFETKKDGKKRIRYKRIQNSQGVKINKRNFYSLAAKQFTYSTSLLFGLLILLFLAAILLSALLNSDTQLLVPVLLLYLFCCLNVFYVLTKIFDITLILSVPSNNRTLVAGGTDLKVAFRCIYLWRVFMVATLFIIYSSVFNKITFVYLCIGLAFLVQILSRNLVSIYAFSSFGTKRVFAIIFSVLMSLSSSAIMASMILHDESSGSAELGNNSYMKEFGIDLSLENSLSVEIVGYSLLIFLFLIVLIDTISAFNIFGNVYLRYRAISQFSRDKSTVKWIPEKFSAKLMIVALLLVVIGKGQVEPGAETAGFFGNALIIIAVFLFSEALNLRYTELNLEKENKKIAFWITHLMASLVQIAFLGAGIYLLYIRGFISIQLLVAVFAVLFFYFLSRPFIDNKKTNISIKFLDSIYWRFSNFLAKQKVSDEDVFKVIFPNRT